MVVVEEQDAHVGTVGKTRRDGAREAVILQCDNLKNRLNKRPVFVLVHD